MKLKEIKIIEKDEQVNLDTINNLYNISKTSTINSSFTGNLSTEYAKLAKIQHLQKSLPISINILDEVILEYLDFNNSLEILTVASNLNWAKKFSLLKLFIYDYIIFNSDYIIDTELNFRGDTNYKIKCVFLANNVGESRRIFGGYGVGGANSHNHLDISTDGYLIGNNTINGNATTICLLTFNEIHTIEWTASTLTVDGEDFAFAMNLSPNYSSTISFGGRTSWSTTEKTEYFSGNIYLFLIYYKDILIKDYRGAISSSNKNILLNIATGSYSYNSKYIYSKTFTFLKVKFINCILKSEVENITNIGGGYENGNYRPFSGSNVEDLTILKYFKNIPKYLTGESPTSNGVKGVFMSCTKLKKIAFPSQINTIKYGAFYNCTALEELDLTGITSFHSDPNSWTLEYYGASGFHGAFCNCTKLKKIIFDPNLKDFEHSAIFKDCTSLKLSYIPNNVKSIDYYVFTNTKCNFKYLPESVTTINGFPWASTTIQTYPLYNSYIFSWSGVGGKSIGKYMKDDDILSVDENHKVTFKDVVSIGLQAFQNNQYIKEVDCAGSTIGSYCFKNCTSLTNVKNGKIGNSTNNVFYGCTGLTTITSDIWKLFDTALPENTFRDCKNITSITLPDRIIGTFYANSIYNTNITTLNTGNCTYLHGNDNLLRESKITELICPKITSFSAWSRSLLPVNAVYCYFPELITIPNTNRFTTSEKNKVIIGEKLLTIGVNISDYGPFKYIVILRKDDIPTMSATSLAGTGIIYVLDVLYDQYKVATNWSTFYNAGRLKPISEFITLYPEDAERFNITV